MNESRIHIRVAVDGAELASELFRRNFGVDPPEFPHHVLAFHRDESGKDLPACYVHFTSTSEFLLGGGACVDVRVMRRMNSHEKETIRAAGGLYRMTLDWAVRYFEPTHKAIFGYCGDALAERIDFAAGFEATQHKHLLVRWLCDIPLRERSRLISLAHAYGAF